MEAQEIMEIVQLIRRYIEIIHTVKFLALLNEGPSGQNNYKKQWNSIMS